MSEQPAQSPDDEPDFDESVEFAPDPDAEWPNAVPPVEGIGPVSQDPNLVIDQDQEA